jgi:hypothetical protein
MFHLLQLEGRLQDNWGLLIAPLLLLILLVVLLQRFGFSKSQKLPPGPWPWPVVGNLFMLGKSPHLAVLLNSMGHLCIFDLVPPILWWHLRLH